MSNIQIIQAYIKATKKLKQLSKEVPTNGYAFEDYATGEHSIAAYKLQDTLGIDLPARRRFIVNVNMGDEITSSELAAVLAEAKHVAV